MDYQRRAHAACERIVAEVERSPQYAHTSHLLVDIGGERVFDRHLGGPRRADVFSVTKTVLATLIGGTAATGDLPRLDDPVSDALPVLLGTPSEHDTWRQLLTMTRGSVTDGEWDVDAVTALPGGQVEHIANAPKKAPPGAFRYDNGASHLLAAALAAVTGEPVGTYAQRRLFDPLGIDGSCWLADPDGVSYGFGHLQLSADDLAVLGALWLGGGSYEGERIVEPAFWAAMTTPHSAGGPPEDLAYGFQVWLSEDSLLAGGWAGQHVLVLPRADAVVVTTGHPAFDFGPPPSDALPSDWRPALGLVRTHLLPVLLGR